MYKKAVDTSRVWFRFSKNIKGSENVRFRWEKLCKERFEEYIDFKMNYFVKQEATHIAAGIPESTEAMAEYRKIIVNKCENTSYHPSICCIDDETSKMIAADALMLYSRRDIKHTALAQTAEVKNLNIIEHGLNKLCHVRDVMAKYNVDRYFDDGDTVIHPDYRGYRITTSVSLLRQIVCMANAVPLTGAWLTHIGTQCASRREGWETVYEISIEDLEKKFGMEFQNAPPTFIYKVKLVV